MTLLAPLPSGPFVPTRRRGVTLVELLVVLMIVGATLAISLPKLSKFRDKSAVRSAKLEIASYLSTARNAAIRRGLSSQFRISNGAIWVTVSQTTGSPATIAPSVALDKTRAVTIAPSGGSSTFTDSVVYDPRGLASLSSSKTVYVITRNNQKDSVCISRLGLIAKECGL